MDRLSIAAGQACPKQDYWFTHAKQHSRQYFKQGNHFPDFESSWGHVYWQYDTSTDDVALMKH